MNIDSIPKSNPIEMNEYRSSHSDTSSLDHTSVEDGDGQDMTLEDVEAPVDELAKNLPELVQQLKQLRIEMERCSKVYEAITFNQASMRNSDRIIPTEAQLMESYHASTRSSIPEYHASTRSSIPEYETYEHMRMTNTQEEEFPTGAAVLVERPSSLINLRRSQRQTQHLLAQRGSIANPRMSTSMRMSTSYNPCDYTVMWVSGECGISLRNFSTNKIGAQIAVLQQADGVTTGISHCRLGDQLLTVNDERVDDIEFTEIVNKLKRTRRPITLGFRMTQNIQTSPTSRGTRTSIHSFRGSTKLYDEDIRSSARSTDGEKSITNDLLIADRQTQSSSDVRSSTSTAMSDDVELWCKEQEEMHSELLVLLTETVLRCEKLQQQNLDQLQNLMQLAPTEQTSSEIVFPPLSTFTTSEEA